MPWMFGRVVWNEEKHRKLSAESMKKAGDSGQHYDHLLLYNTQDSDGLLDLRKRLVARRDHALSLQKQSVGEEARGFKQDATEAMKLYRACCWLISQFVGHPPGDCRGVEINKDLAPFADRICNAALWGDLKASSL